MTLDPAHWLEQVYGAKDRAALEVLYNQWADDYDADLQRTGYLHYAVMAGLVARHVPQRSAAILDAGVGTGAFGGVLSLLGFNNLYGIDMSDAMLAKAAALKCYVGLQRAVLGEPLDSIDQSFDAIVSTGTFTTGHAPASALPELARLLEAHGVLMLTVGTEMWETGHFAEVFTELGRTGVLQHVETTPIYCPMPLSETESGFTTRAHVYRRM
jgi:predicted TPR repeat methyltransferase